MQACPILILSPFLPSRRGSRGAAGVRSPTEYASPRSRRAAAGTSAPGTVLLGATRMWSHGASSPRDTTGGRATHLRPKHGEHGTTGGRADARFRAARVRPAVPLVPPRAAGRWRRKSSAPGPAARGGGDRVRVRSPRPDPRERSSRTTCGLSLPPAPARPCSLNRRRAGGSPDPRTAPPTWNGSRRGAGAVSYTHLTLPTILLV